MNERIPLPHRPADEPSMTVASSTATGSIAALVEAGLPLEAGLRALSEEAPSRRIRRVLRQMSQQLADGQSPDDVLTAKRGGFPVYLKGLVRAGVQTGQLGSFLEQFLQSLRQRRASSFSFWAMMAYPLLLLPLAMLVGFLVLGWIVPQFADIFNDFGVELPQMTLMLITLSDRLVVKWIILGILLIAILNVLVVFAGPWIPGHATRLRMFQDFPVIGTSSRMRGLSEFCSLLGLLVSGQIPLPDALRMTASALRDANLREGSLLLARRVEDGETLEFASRGLPQISSQLSNLFRWESRGSAFGDILLRAGELFAMRSRVQAGLIVMIIQPFVFVGVSLFIGFVVISLFMPLVKLLNELP